MGYTCKLRSSSSSSKKKQNEGDNNGNDAIDDNRGGDDDEEDEEYTSWRKLLIISTIFGVPVLLMHVLLSTSASVEMTFMTPVPFPLCRRGGLLAHHVTMFLLNLPLQTVVGKRFYQKAYKGAQHGNYGMDFLVTLGTVITFAYSMLNVSFGCLTGIPSMNVFFEASGMLLMFVTAGKFMEAYARRNTHSSLTALLKLQPQDALLVVDGKASLAKLASSSSSSSSSSPTNPQPFGVTMAGEALEVRRIDLALVQEGDILQVLPGSRVPVDGTIVKGSSYIDESVITGESIPVEKTIGDDVFGSTVNQHGSIFIEAKSIGSDSALAQIVRLVEDAQMQKAPIQEYADYLAGKFTPFVLTVAVLTFITWLTLSLTHVVPSSWFEEEYGDPWLFATLFAISVIVISCPCALGLATPTAVMVGTTVGAQQGLLIKGGQAFEMAHKVTCVVFDKTGTLTTGKPSVTDVVVVKAVPLPSSLSSGRQVSVATTPSTSSSSSSSPSSSLVDVWRVSSLLSTTHANPHPTPSSSSSSPSGREGVNVEMASASRRSNPSPPPPILNQIDETRPAVHLLQLAASCETMSEHPIAAAIVQEAKNRKLPLYSVDAFVAIPGMGVQCRINGFGDVTVGSSRWAMTLIQQSKMQKKTGGLGPSSSTSSSSSSTSTFSLSMKIEGLDSSLERELRDLERQGKTAVVVMLNGSVLGMIAVADTIKPDAQESVQALQQLGLHVWMITGDGAATGIAVAAEVGIDSSNVLANVLPADKAAAVEQLQKDGHVVAMVGDGINDSVALAQADVGMAVGAGTQIAIEAADIVLVRSTLSDVVVALHLSRVVFSRIRMNFGWAMIYNLFAIPFAAGILFPWTHTTVPPQYAGLCMAFSSVSVVLSSLWLRFYKRPSLKTDDANNVYTTLSRPSSSSAPSPATMVRTTIDLGRRISSTVAGGGGGAAAGYLPIADDGEGYERQEEGRAYEMGSM